MNEAIRPGQGTQAVVTPELSVVVPTFNERDNVIALFRKLEAALAGQALTPDLAQIALPVHVAHLKPVSDIRGTAQYRSDAALTLVRRALAEVALD